MCLSQATYDSLSPDQRALAAELFYEHRMAKSMPRPANRLPVRPTGGATNKPKHQPGTQSGELLAVLKGRGDWLRACDAGKLVDLTSSEAAKALHRLLEDGLVEYRRITKSHSEWRVTQ